MSDTAGIDDAGHPISCNPRKARILDRNLRGRISSGPAGMVPRQKAGPMTASRRNVQSVRKTTCQSGPSTCDGINPASPNSPPRDERQFAISGGAVCYVKSRFVQIILYQMIPIGQEALYAADHAKECGPRSPFARSSTTRARSGPAVGCPRRRRRAKIIAGDGAILRDQGAKSRLSPVLQDG